VILSGASTRLAGGRASLILGFMIYGILTLRIWPCGEVHIRALQELLGHKSVIMTQRYSHLAPEQLQNAVKLLDGVIEKRFIIS
jgi:integrase